MQHRNMRGADLHAPTNELVENNTGSLLPPLAVVGLNGMGTCYPQVTLADPTDPLKPLVFGVVQANSCGLPGGIPSGKSGYVTVLGFMFGADTSAWPVNTLLYGDALGALSSTPLGSPVAFVVKQDAANGVLYVFGVIGEATAVEDAWRLIGNAATNPAVNFLGTIDANPLKIRTNNNPVAQFDVNGRLAIGAHNPASPLHIKSYPGYTGSGLQVDTFSLTTSAASATSIYTVNVANNSLVKIKFQVTARLANGTHRATFTRSGLFYRQGSNVQIQGGWQSDFTQMSITGFKVNYQLNVNDVTFNVTPLDASNTFWVGHVEMESLGDSV